MATPEHFELFTSLRYDPLLLKSEENNKLAFTRPCPFYMLLHHRNRVAEAANFFGFDAIEKILSDGPSYQQFLSDELKAWQEQNKTEDGPLKVKIVFSREGKIKVELSPVPLVDPENLYPSTLELPERDIASKPPQVSSLTGGALRMGPDDYKPASATGRNVTSIKPSFNIIIDPLPTEVTPHTMLKTTYRPHYDASRVRAFHSAITNSGLENKEVLLHNPAGEMMEGSVTTPYFYRNGRWVTPPVGSEHGGQRGTTRRWALATGMAVEEIVPRESVQTGERLWLSNGVRGFAWGVVAELR